MTTTYERIASTTLSSTTNTVTFSSIPSTYTDLVVASSFIKTGASGEAMFVTINGDNGSNYSYTWFGNSGSSLYAARVASDTRIQVYQQGTTSGIFNVCNLNVQNYSNTTTNKSIIVRNGTADLSVSALVGLWRSTSAITSITLTPDNYLSPVFVVGSTFSLYGIKAE